MEMTITEALFIFSSAIALPVIAVLTYSYFIGGLSNTERARFLPVIEEDTDWWTKTKATDAPSPSEGGEES